MDSETVFELKTLTPLWLGDVDRDSVAARESGLIGSLRFWYEGLLRSMNLDVCDPVETKRCDGNRFCEACALFGTTGRARRFRLEVEGLRPTELFFRASPAVATATKAWLSRVFAADASSLVQTQPGRRAQFRFGVQALWTAGTFRITVRHRRKDSRWDGPVAALLTLTLSEAARLGGIGAKTQNGFGQVKLVSPSEPEVKELVGKAREFLEGRKRWEMEEGGMFTLSERRFFSQLYDGISRPNMVDIGQPPADYVEALEPYIPCAFDIRYKRSLDSGLRPAFQSAFGRNMARELLGSLKGDNAWASRIHVSHLYSEQPEGRSYKLKIWGDVRRKDVVEEAIARHIHERFGVMRQKG